MLHFFWSLSAFILTLVVLITVHEFGHFWVARCCGVTVERFSIGFGRVLWRHRGKRGTEYVIAAILLGGYIKMLGEQIGTVAPEYFHEAFNHKKVWQRAAIIIAGPIFNFIFAIFVYWLVFLIGIPSYRPVIGEVIPHSIVAKAEIYPGMELTSVNGISTPDWNSVRLQLIDKIGDDKITIGVSLLGSQNTERKTLDLSDWQFEPYKQDVIVALGIIPLGPCAETVLAEVKPGSAAMKAGLQAGDRVIKVNGLPITTWQLFVTYVRDNPGRLLQVGIDRHGEARDIILQPDSKLMGNGETEGFAGIVPKVIPLPVEYKIVQQYNPLSALAQASEKILQLIQLTVSMLGKLLTGDIKIRNLSGPISIAQSAGISAEYGLIYYLMFLAIISINLGIINLLPLSILDGGHLFFLAIEKLNGGAMSEQVQDFSYRISSILLVLLMSLSIFNDFSRL